MQGRLGIVDGGTAGPMFDQIAAGVGGVIPLSRD